MTSYLGPPEDNRKIIRDVWVPSQVIANFHEVILGDELMKIDKRWRRGNPSEKDLIYIPDDFFSTEVKASGQLGGRIFGNRSYSQATANYEKKEKSGYYITINFHQDLLYLVRFGWIDFEDWRGQNAPTGQMASLPREVYENKLLVLKGEYQLSSPLETLPGIGPRTLEKVSGFITRNNIRTVSDFISAVEDNKPLANANRTTVQRIYEKAKRMEREILSG